jgi:hypothetical protein
MDTNSSHEPEAPVAFKDNKSLDTSKESHDFIPPTSIWRACARPRSANFVGE